MHGSMILMEQFPVFFSHGTSNSCSVLIAYLGKTTFVLNKHKTDKAGRMFILDVMLDGDHYILINLYNGNTETEQFKLFNEFQSLLNIFDINQKKRIIFAGDLNIFFSAQLKARGGKPILKTKSIIKLVHIKEAWIFVILGELEIFSVKILHLDKTIPPDL